jgi:hypothetical protein
MTLMNWAQKSASIGDNKQRGWMQCSIIELTSMFDLVAAHKINIELRKTAKSTHNEQTNYVFHALIA